EAEEKFKEAAEAYEVLSNPEKRQRYDQFGHAGGASGGFGGGGMNMEDIFSQFGDIFGGGGSAFESFFGGGSQRGGRRVAKGSNLRIKVKLTLSEIAKGAEKESRLIRKSFAPLAMALEQKTNHHSTRAVPVGALELYDASPAPYLGKCRPPAPVRLVMAKVWRYQPNARPATATA